VVNSVGTPAPDDRSGGSRVRDRLANERTFLAWLRTAANVMIVGLGIARFGDGGDVSSSSLAAGSILVVVGAVGVFYGSARYRTAGRQLERGGSMVGAHTTGPIVASAVLVVAVVAAVLVLVAGHDIG
jgi:putative membrane protein